MNTNQLLGSVNAPIPSFPSLRITPDARSGSMGETGIATKPDVHSIFHNTSKLAFTKDKFGITASYTPWLKEMVPDVFLFNASAFWKMDSLNAITASFNYFDLGQLTFLNISGAYPRDNYNPSELAFHLGYARKMKKDLSLGINIGYGLSHPVEGIAISGVPTQLGKTILVDASLTHVHAIKKHSVLKEYALGMVVSNLGNKISYTESNEYMNFIPANLGIGSALHFQFSRHHKLSFALDLNKLLVPTPEDFSYNNSESVIVSAWQSFTDAPGGLKEELHEITYSTGLEYIFHDILAVRGGYFYEYPDKGNRHYFTIGLGLHYDCLQIDGSLIVATTPYKSPLDNTLRITASLLFDKLSFKNWGK